MSLERRKHARVPEEMKFALQGGPIPAGQTATGRIVDLSEGGAQFECPHPIPDGQVIAFELRLPINVEARIVRSEKIGGTYRYGMFFEKVEWLDRETLRRYIRRKLGLAS